MAKVFLSAGDDFVAASDAQVFGSTGAETVEIVEQHNVTLNSNVDRVTFTGGVADYTYQVQGNQVIVRSGAAVVATIGVQDDADGTRLVFADGSVHLNLTGLNQVTLGGAVVPTTAGSVTPTTIDTTEHTGTTLAGKTFALTVGVDSGAAFTGGAGDDTFNAAQVGNGDTWSGADSIDGGGGTNTFNVAQADAISNPVGTSVKNIQIANLSSADTVNVDTTAWTGLTTLTTSSIGTTTVTAAPTTAVTANVKAPGGTSTVDGGSTVSLTETGLVAGNGVAIGTMTPVAGSVTLNTTTKAADGFGVGAIVVTAAGNVAITQTAGNAVNTTNVLGAVTVNGGASTTSVSVTNSKAAAAAATVVGVGDNAINVLDVNNLSPTKAGVITSVTASGYTTLTVSDNALTTLNASNGSGNITINNGGLATPTNKTLALNLNGVSGGVLDDGDIYTAINVTTAGSTAATLANITDTALTALTVGGTQGLTLTSTAGMAKLSTVGVTGSAGLSADLSAATVTAVDTSGTTGNSTITLDASKATFTGGAGADAVTLSSNAPTKAVSLGDGDDSLTLAGGTSVVSSAIAGGSGTDTLKMSAADAATASSSATFGTKVTGFERVALSGATNQTVDLGALGNYNYVTTHGGNGLTLNNLSNGGKLVLDGAGTAYTIANSAFAAGTSDLVNLALTDGSGGGVAFASTGITASGVEAFAISVADTQATPAGAFNDSLSLLGNSAKTITVGGNAGLTLTATDTALTSLDASGISLGGFIWTSGALAAAATVKGSATGANNVDFSAATGDAVTYTGGSGNDTVAANNGKNNVITLGGGDNVVLGNGADGNQTVTGGTGGDVVFLRNGNNIVSLGDGTNTFSAGDGKNTYTGGAGTNTVTLGNGNNTVTGGAGDDTVTVGSGNNTISVGAGTNVVNVGAGLNVVTLDSAVGTDTVNITAASTSSGIYSTVSNFLKGDSVKLGVNDTTTTTAQFDVSKITLAPTAVFQDYLNAAINAGKGTNFGAAWFQWNGDTFIAESGTNAGAGHSSFVNGADYVVRLTGVVDLTTATVAGGAIMHG
jgi:S-layer protein